MFLTNYLIYKSGNSEILLKETENSMMRIVLYPQLPMLRCNN